MALRIFHVDDSLSEKEAVKLSMTPAKFVDLNENVNARIEDFPSSMIYKLQAKFSFKSYLQSLDKEIVTLNCDYGPFNITGTFDSKMWRNNRSNRGYLNTMLGYQEGEILTWIQLTPTKDGYEAKFLIIAKAEKSEEEQEKELENIRKSIDLEGHLKMEGIYLNKW